MVTQKAFVYVFTPEDCQKLRAMHYRFLKSTGSIYIFINEDLGGLEEIEHTFTDSIGF